MALTPEQLAALAASGRDPSQREQIKTLFEQGRATEAARPYQVSEPGLRCL